jgi:glycosyltransferase involved in cell wall biosynthesis
MPAEAQIVFVSDAYPEHLVGGAELTLQALIDTAPVKVHKLLCGELTAEHLKQGAEKFWIFGNYASLNPQLIPAIASSVRYGIVECDYKFCKYRSVEKHELTEGKPCDCNQTQLGATCASFMSAAEHVWWMSETQRDVYLAAFPFLIDYDSTVLSSVFNDAFFDSVNALRAEDIAKSDKWLILNSQSWVKGTELSEKVARDRGLDYELVGGVSYDEMLRKLAGAKGLVFCPAGGDTCPRLVIEAKLLGCDLLLNANVQHAKESWFDTDDIAQVESYLRGAPAAFWRVVGRAMRKEVTLSGYATTFNCVKQEYPFEACVESMLGFCDEVVVVDAGSTDGTLAKLLTLQHAAAVDEVPSDVMSISSIDGALKAMNGHSRLKVYVVERDWNDPRSALFDGMQKAEARRRCTGDFCWQMDVDEVVRREDWKKVRELVQNFPKAVPMLSLPVVEYWGGFDKVRLDVTPWKWRVSRNSPRITHGVPASLRAKDAEGRDIALPGTDGCDPVDAATGEPIVFLGFLTNEMEQARQMALAGDAKAAALYENWLSRVVSSLPSVYHASWLDIERKIRLYRDFWTRHWTVLNGKDYVDSAETNMFFDMPWSEVTDEDIKARAKELSEKTGGHVWHSKWKGQATPHMTLSQVPPPAELETLYRR